MTRSALSREEVAVEAALKPHRTTEIFVSPTALKTVANPRNPCYNNGK